ncbi:hypothetical protein C0583_05585 [Candidatus Parcubacteria bacterium]|nr:MAG: hypothetical protein C0583_05585 [Candidatus Parcubacteria bacterium]
MENLNKEVFKPNTPEDIKNDINMKLQHWDGLYETVSGWVNFKENLPLTMEDIAKIMTESEIAHNNVIKYFSEGGEGFEKQPEFSKDKVLQFSELVILELRDKVKTLENK